MNKKSYFSVDDKIKELSELRYDGVVKGLSTGIEPLDDICSLKKGYPFYIAGSPHSGKTELGLEILLNTSVLYGWKHLVYSGESGSVSELIAELCYKLIGKPYLTKNTKQETITYCMSESERMYAEQFIAQHFYFIDTEEIDTSITDFTISEFYSLANSIENELGISFDTTYLDPFNDAIDESHKYNGRQDFFISSALKICRRDAKKNNRVNFIITHVADIAPVIDKETKLRYTPVPMPSEWSGGREWHRRGFQMGLCYRPPTFLNNEYGQPHKDNELHFFIQKSKPKGVGKLGKAILYWDYKRNNYYWVNNSGEIKYSKRPYEIKNTIHQHKELEPKNSEELLNKFFNSDGKSLNDELEPSIF
jgi:hypothetical protein